MRHFCRKNDPPLDYPPYPSPSPYALFRGVVTGRARGAAAVPPDFWNPKKLSHKNAIKSEISKKWGKIGLLAPLTFGARDAPGPLTLTPKPWINLQKPKIPWKHMCVPHYCPKKAGNFSDRKTTVTKMRLNQS